VGVCGMDLCGSGLGCCEYGNECSGDLKDDEFLD
jgi:hypothetical protein